MYTNAKNIPVEIIPVESGKRGWRRAVEGVNSSTSDTL
jgi:hypothetical protein